MDLIDRNRLKCDYCGRVAPYNCGVCAKDLCGTHRTNHDHAPLILGF